jgi:hypothetical protein
VAHAEPFSQDQKDPVCFRRRAEQFPHQFADALERRGIACLCALQNIRSYSPIARNRDFLAFG